MSHDPIAPVRPQVRWRFGKCRQRGYGKWTEIEVDLPPYPVSLHILRSPSCTQANIHDALDLHLDATCRAEISPRDIVIAAFDSALRQIVLSHGVCMLDTISDGDRTVLSFATPGRSSPAQIDAIAAHLVAFGARLRDIYADLTRAAGVGLTGDPFRPVLDDSPGQRAIAARQALVVQLIHDRSARRRRSSAGSSVAVGAVIALLITIALSLAG